MSSWARLRAFARYEEAVFKFFSGGGRELHAGRCCEVLRSADNGGEGLNSELECAPSPLIAMDVLATRERRLIFEVEPGYHVSILVLLWRWSVVARTRRLFSEEEL